MLTLTENAVGRVKTFAAQDQSAAGKGLRIYVQGGGCSGFQYGFAFDDPKDDDQVTEVGEIRVLVDPFSAPYVQGCSVDYVEDFRGSGFVVQNPNAKGTCGCGTSFHV